MKSYCTLLQDLKIPAIRIANGEHTAVKLARRLPTGVAYVARHDRADSSVEMLFSRAREKRCLMKSLTIAIRNREQRVIGLLCINMNLDVPFSQIIIPLFRRKRRKSAQRLILPPSVED